MIKIWIRFTINCAIVLFCLIAAFIPCEAATYTICSLGCTATSFSGLFSAVDLAPGDIVEAQANTPGGTKTFTETISPGPNDFGGPGNPLIIRARAGDTIIIDANGGAYGVKVADTTNGHITFDGFTVQNYSYAGFYLRGVSSSSTLPGITVQNCTMNSNIGSSPLGSTQGVLLGRVDHAIIKNNIIHVADVNMPWQTDCFYVQESNNVDIDGNLCWDQNRDGSGHNDGLQVAGGNGTIPFGSTYNITLRNNILVHDNFHNNSKQLIYFEYEVGGNNYIYNNVVYVTTGSASFMVSVYNKAFGTQGNFYFFNNTFRAKDSQVVFAADLYSSNITFQNNIVYGESLLMAVQNTTNNPTNFKNNLYYNPKGSTGAFVWGSSYKDWTGWKAAGFDNTHGVWGDPLFISGSAYPYDLHVTGNSPSEKAGLDLSTVFTTDKDGKTRITPWDIGAYRQMGIPPPANLRIVSD